MHLKSDSIIEEASYFFLKTAMRPVFQKKKHLENVVAENRN